MSDLILGAHMSIANGFLGAVKEAHEEYGANALQIFCKSPRGRFEKALSEEEAKATRDYIKEKNIKWLNAHCSYLLNFAKPIDKDPWPVNSLISDVVKTYHLGGQGVVLHIGKYLELPKDEAFKYLKINLERVLEETEDTPALILLEITAGQGTEIGFKFEELAEVYDMLSLKSRVGFCFDTAHAFAAGYDISSKDKVRDTFDTFNSLLGINNLKLIHLNDSKKPLGSRVDRHANFGSMDANIGKDGIIAVAEFAVNHEIPMILETPEINGSHLHDLELLRGWIA